MKKIKFAIASTFIIIFMIAIFAFAAEVKNTLPATPTCCLRITAWFLQHLHNANSTAAATCANFR